MLARFIKETLDITTYVNGENIASSTLSVDSLRSKKIKNNDKVRIKLKGDCTEETLEKVLDIWEDLLQDEAALERSEKELNGYLKRVVASAYSLGNDFTIPENIEKNAKKVIALLTNALMMWSSKSPYAEKDDKEESKERRVLAIDIGNDADNEAMELIYKYLVGSLKDMHSNNGQLEIILKDVHIIVGRGEKLKQRLDALMTQPEKNKLKKENTIIITPKTNLSIFDDFEGHAFITAFDDSELTRNGEELPYYPIIEIAFFTLLRVLEGNNDVAPSLRVVSRLKKWYRRIPNIDLEEANIFKLCFDDDYSPRKTVILKLKNVVKFDHDKLEAIYGKMQEFIKNA